ncbi:AraC family transcriptional regulator [Streptomyces sp. DSM 44915]|uniref:AraC family transcriptional regulator n=1 Tax=Streptomyces chisholmiae TaxID=3075540 RepID=A0ABU2JJV3_9ACTN|nr:AraC family transcriptional regulator [Streptomyces sp. DSM 44915]MDT0265018.1 AraC family transcriptional regulator [Streptomyces sp. DSM 44915]
MELTEPRGGTDPSTDPIDELLRGVRTDEVRVRRTELTPPWTLRLPEAGPADDAALTLCAPLRGEGWLAPAAGGGAAARRVRVNDTVIVRGSALATPQVRLTDRPPAGGPGEPAPAARTVLLLGAYRVRGEVSRRLLDLLPPVLVVPGEEDCSSLLDFLDGQFAGGAAPGQQVVVDRLLDWLLVCTLRDWFDRPEAGSPGWFRALGDAAVGPALRALHAAPQRPWTLAALAREAGVSRTTLASRFSRLVGEPPLAYLTHWRMALAADLLTESTATVAAVARQVGYADAFGFSTAFKRARGMSPTAYRDCAARADCRPAAPAPA